MELAQTIFSFTVLALLCLWIDKRMIAKKKKPEQWWGRGK